MNERTTWPYHEWVAPLVEGALRGRYRKIGPRRWEDVPGGRCTSRPLVMAALANHLITQHDALDRSTMTPTERRWWDRALSYQGLQAMLSRRSIEEPE